MRASPVRHGPDARSLGRLGVAALLLAGGALAVVHLSGGSPEPPPPSILSSPPAPPTAVTPALPLVGNPAPDFALPDLEGRIVRLSDLKGRPVLVNFWATWCPPCREEMPAIEEFYRKYEGRIEVVGVDVGEKPETVREFLADQPFSWTFALDASGTAMQSYLVSAIPMSYFIDADGVIQAKYIGPMSPALLEDFAAKVGAQ